MAGEKKSPDFSTTHILLVILLFVLLIAGIFFSEYFEFGLSKSTPGKSQYGQGSRLEQIRKGMIGK